MQHTTVRSALRQRVRAFAALLALQALLFAPCAAADIYKCVAKDGSGAPLFQNFPCTIDSLGLPSSPAAAQSTPAVATDKPKAQPTPASASTSNATELQIGISSEEVRALLGDPQSVEEDEPGEGGRTSIWRYADGRSVQFDDKRRVREIQQR